MTSRVQRSTSASRAGMAFGLVAVVVLASLPYWGDRALMRLLVEIFYILALAQLWNLLAGYGGLVSVGQQAFVGLGGYLLFILVIFADIGALWTVPLAGVIGAVVSLPIAFVVFRLRGHYFAIGTWVVAEVFLLGFAQAKVLGGGSGMSLPIAAIKSIAASRAARDMVIYWVALALIVVVIAAVYLLLRSRHGLALTAIRDSEEASRSLGVDNFRAKLLVYILAAFGTSAIGALIYLTKIRISPSAAFDINWTTTIIFIVVIGGIGSIEGPDSRHGDLLLAARAPGALRVLVPDPSGSDRGGRHAQGAQGDMGLGGGALRRPSFPGSAASGFRATHRTRPGRP